MDDDLDFLPDENDSMLLAALHHLTTPSSEDDEFLAEWFDGE